MPKMQEEIKSVESDQHVIRILYDDEFDTNYWNVLLKNKESYDSEVFVHESRENAEEVFDKLENILI